MIINGDKLLELSPIVNMEKTKLYSNGVSYGLSEAGYDIRIKQTVVFTSRWGVKKITVVDADVNGKQVVTKTNGSFVLASSMEEFNNPSNLVGVVHDKSSWARRGLSVFNTLVEPGWKGWLTLELVYHGSDELTIEAGSGIAQVIFHQVSCRAQYTGRYQGQANHPVSAITA